MSIGIFRVLWSLGLAACWTCASYATLAAQGGVVQGTVIEEGTGRPVPGAQVVVVGQPLGVLTNAQGRFQILNVPVGERTLRVELVGYRAEPQVVTVAAGQSTTVTLVVQQAAVALQEIVVTGVAGATQRAKVPFEISTVRAEDMPVPTINAAAAIQGKVAGATVVAGTGRPGAAPSVLLRGPTSINTEGRSHEPLYIVDGVILSASIADIGAMDIESIEVVKGAAAASLYGSRAANGVVQITTRRGARMGADQVRYSARTELGRSAIGRTPDALLGKFHPFAMSGDTMMLNAAGAPCHYRACTTLLQAGQRRGDGAADDWNTFQVNRWPGETFDHLQRFFQDGTYTQNTISAEGRSGATTFHVSFDNLNDGGIVPGMDGLRRNAFRVNVDQTVHQNIALSASAFYSRASAGQIETSNGGNPFFQLTRMPAGIDIWGCEADPLRSCREQPDSLVLLPNPRDNEAINPAYRLLNRRFFDERGRFLGSANLRVTPLPWLDIDGNVSYDRLDLNEEEFYPKGFRTPLPSETLNNGYLYRFSQRTEGVNSSVTGTARFNLGERVANRTQVRYLYEHLDHGWNWTSGFDMQVAGIVDFGNFNAENFRANSFATPVRADGYFAITNFDIADRYIVDALVRNDGSSLFGPDQRRHWYYRLAGAWRVAEEPWFRAPVFDELKLRASYGTAGGTPRFEAQYETFSVAGGAVQPIALGNRALKPEFSRELEAGIDAAILNGRVVLGLTHASARTDDQILRVPLAGFTGYEYQWQNAGTLASNTWEASVDARIFQRGSMSWSGRVLFDRTRSTITRLNVPDFTFGDAAWPIGGQNLNRIFYAREGERLGTFYGAQLATGCAHLPAGVSCDGFTVDGNGYLVYVGGGSLADAQWGTDAPLELRGQAPHLAALRWGTPFRAVCSDRVSNEQTLYCPLGNSLPDFNVSFASTFNWGGFSLYGLLDAAQGFSVYNQPLQWATFARTNALFDQADVPEVERRPMGYFAAIYGVSGLNPSSAFVEDGSFVKLREMSLRYRFGGDALSRLPAINGFSGLSLMLTGRNLLTWTGYRGFDPEVGKTGGAAGSAALLRVEGFQYPSFRTWTLGAELNF